MRDRLIELIKSKSCRENLCMGKNCADCEYIAIFEGDVEKIADHIIANGVIVPPCKVGDKVYHIKEKTIFVMPVKWFETNNYGWCACCVYPPMATFTFKFEDFGKTVFLTREDAEKALKGEKII